MDGGCTTPRPVDPALSQWLRKSFSFTPETPFTTSGVPRTPLRSSTGPRKSRNLSLGRPSTRRKSAEFNASVEEETLPVVKKRRVSRRNKTHSDNNVLSDDRIGRSDPASSVVCTATTAPGQGRRLIMEAVEITKLEHPVHDVHALQKGVRDWTQIQGYSPGPRASGLPVEDSVSAVPRKRETSSTRRSETPNTCRSGANQTYGKRRTRDETQRKEVDSHLNRLRRSSVSRPRLKRDHTLSASAPATPVAPPGTSRYFTAPYLLATSIPTSGTSAIVDTNTKPTVSPILTVASAKLPACRVSDLAKPPRSTFQVSSQEKYEDWVKDFMVMLRILKPKLIQEAVCHDPWKVLLAVRLLNVTTGRMAIPVFWKIVRRWPTPQDLVNAPLDELIELIRPLGLYNKRAKWFKEISQCYIEDPPRYFMDSSHSPNTCATSIKPCRRKARSSYPDTPISHFPGVGPYAFDSFRIFCTSPHGPVEAIAKEEWKDVMPNDKELIRYLRWKWAYEEHKIWYPIKGVIGKVNLAYLISLVDELAEHYDIMVGGEGYIDEFIECIVSDNC